MTLWILLSAAAAVAYTLLTAWLLPRILLKNKYVVGEIKDRGIEKYSDGRGAHAVAYEPSLEVRRFISQYVLIDDGEKKSLVVRLTPEVDYIECDVVIFDSRSKAVGVIRLSQLAEGGRESEPVQLPAETSYVTILPRRVNNERFRHRVRGKVPFGRFMLYSLLSVLASPIAAYLIRLGIANALGGVFRESFAADTAGLVETLVIAAALSALSLIIVSITVKIKNSRLNKK